MAEVEQPVMEVTTVAMKMMMQEYAVREKKCKGHTNILKHRGEKNTKLIN